MNGGMAYGLLSSGRAFDRHITTSNFVNIRLTQLVDNIGKNAKKYI